VAEYRRTHKFAGVPQHCETAPIDPPSAATESTARPMQ
jgi:hypothetical protein